MLIYVKWEDHSHGTSWNTADEIENKAICCETIGFLIKEDKKFIIVSHTKSEPGDFCGYIKIIKSCVIERCELEINE